MPHDRAAGRHDSRHRFRVSIDTLRAIHLIITVILTVTVLLLWVSAIPGLPAARALALFATPFALNSWLGLLLLRRDPDRSSPRQ